MQKKEKEKKTIQGQTNLGDKLMGAVLSVSLIDIVTWKDTADSCSHAVYSTTGETTAQHKDYNKEWFKNSASDSLCPR